MNVHVSYRLHKTPAVEKETQHQIERLRKRLQVFRPELIHLKGMIEEHSSREGASVSLNLRLPSGQMAVQSSAPTVFEAVRSAFDDLLQQVTRHKELLRATHKWRRRGNGASDRRAPRLPFEKSVAVVFPAAISSEDVRSYVNINLSRLEIFVEREIYFRESQERVVRGAVTKGEVIDETIAAALEDGQEKPERLALEPWLYRLALRALDRLCRGDESDGHAVHLEDSTRQPNIGASDELPLQFHQPDESMTGENVIADTRISTPEQILASDEILRLIASSLRDLGAGPREAFILHAIEGFSVDEITEITGLSADRIQASIAAARDHLRKAPGLARQFHGRVATSGAA